MSEPSSNESGKGGGYGKHSKLYWVLVYVVVAVIVYGLMYVLFFHKSGSSGNGLGY